MNRYIGVYPDSKECRNTIAFEADSDGTALDRAKAFVDFEGNAVTRILLFRMSGDSEDPLEFVADVRSEVVEELRPVKVRKVIVTQ